jgi:hypothetical protein
MFDPSGLTPNPARGQESSLPFKMALCDRRVRMPLEWLADGVATETGEHVSVQGLRRFAADGWFPLTVGADGDAAEPGVYLSTPSRVGVCPSKTGPTRKSGRQVQDATGSVVAGRNRSNPAPNGNGHTTRREAVMVAGACNQHYLQLWRPAA